ncbi:MAG: hypothetical protein E6932_29065, partial [Citrobacter freundii]|nr:hypothetical protein [Citrobacter freundii]
MEDCIDNPVHTRKIDRKNNGSHDDGKRITPRLLGSWPSDSFHFRENTFDKFHHCAPSIITWFLDGPSRGHNVYKT